MPALSATYGIMPWHLGDLTPMELRAYIEALPARR